VGGVIGHKSAQTIESAMAAEFQNNRGLFANGAAIVTLVLTATGMFIELQDALNTIWKVKVKPGSGMMGFIRIRLMSFAMVVGIAFFLLVSLVVSAALAAISRYFSELLPGVGNFVLVTDDLVSFVVITVLFALIFKVLPDIKIAWGDVWVGAAATSLLFTVGKFLLGWYLGRSKTVSAYGAAGSMVLILLWVYYSAQILFFGAEVTKVYATRFGKRVWPASYAQWVSEPQLKKQPETKPKPRILPEPVMRRDRPGKQAQVSARQARLVSELRREVESLRQLVER
jgi:membrane protein